MNLAPQNAYIDNQIYTQNQVVQDSHKQSSSTAHYSNANSHEFPGNVRKRSQTRQNAWGGM